MVCGVPLVLFCSTGHCKRSLHRKIKPQQQPTPLCSQMLSSLCACKNRLTTAVSLVKQLCSTVCSLTSMPTEGIQTERARQSCKHTAIRWANGSIGFRLQDIFSAAGIRFILVSQENCSGCPVCTLARNLARLFKIYGPCAVFDGNLSSLFVQAIFWSSAHLFSGPVQLFSGPAQAHQGSLTGQFAPHGTEH